MKNEVCLFKLGEQQVIVMPPGEEVEAIDIKGKDSVLFIDLPYDLLSFVYKKAHEENQEVQDVLNNMLKEAIEHYIAANTSDTSCDCEFHTPCCCSEEDEDDDEDNEDDDEEDLDEEYDEDEDGDTEDDEGDSYETCGVTHDQVMEITQLVRDEIMEELPEIITEAVEEEGLLTTEDFSELQNQICDLVEKVSHLKKKLRKKH